MANVGELEGRLGLTFVPAGEKNIERFGPRPPRDYPEPYPGHITPTRRPDYGMFVLYEVLRGMNVGHSFKRMVRMYSNMGDVEDVVRDFVRREGRDTGKSGYLNLADAVARKYGLKYDYKETETGHEIRVWGKDKADYVFDMKRGQYRTRSRTNRDYSKLLGVKRNEMLSFKKVVAENEDIVKPFRYKRE